MISLDSEFELLNPAFSDFGLDSQRRKPLWPDGNSTFEQNAEVCAGKSVSLANGKRLRGLFQVRGGWGTEYSCDNTIDDSV